MHLCLIGVSQLPCDRYNLNFIYEETDSGELGYSSKGRKIHIILAFWFLIQE